MTLGPESKNGTKIAAGEPPPRLPGRWELALLEAVQRRNVFIDAAAHDMKNQLTVLRISAQLLERRARSGEAIETAAMQYPLAAIQRSTRKLQRLVDDFFDLSRMQLGEQVEFNLQPTDLVSVARALVDEYAMSEHHTIALTTAIESVVGQWDADRLERVIVNLLSNALKYSPPSSSIGVTLELDPSDRVAVLVVRDEGKGIPAADLPNIFTPYFRGSNVARTTIGTGIGLFGARAAIEQMGGTLQLESTEGIGTAVTIRLPVAPAPMLNPSALPELTAPISPG